ncbi:ankyrin repeat-containing protein [Hypoxylon fragiforme]|uniref:ankyrin repeat-containing protein n=1 Tax=Hypoxylon fragiforme TaxID=63214 RepID=UPI0020C68576|nr:ankyrin repeat-containing protein [Hypoxylon fragiforme]KAI2609336.1 ankyrin repeat-containing protein [Hypoxylon fragiforme]
MSANPFLLAADNSPELLPLLRQNSELAAGQDSHGYSLLHAAASYNHLELLRALVLEFNVDVNLRDEDEETALFVVETVDAARLLVEELGADITIRGSEGFTAREKIDEEGDFPEVAEYLESKEDGNSAPALSNGTNGELPHDELNLYLSGWAPASEEDDVEIDPIFRRRIEEIIARPDYRDPTGQHALRQVIEEMMLAEDPISRNVRQRRESSD